MCDVQFRRSDDLVLLTPRTPAAGLWLRDNADCALRFGSAVAIHRNHAAPVVTGLARAGFAVS